MKRSTFDDTVFPRNYTFHAYSRITLALYIYYAEELRERLERERALINSFLCDVLRWQAEKR